MRRADLGAAHEAHACTMAGDTPLALQPADCGLALRLATAGTAGSGVGLAPAPEGYEEQSMGGPLEFEGPAVDAAAAAAERAAMPDVRHAPTLDYVLEQVPPPPLPLPGGRHFCVGARRRGRHPCNWHNVM